MNALLQLARARFDYVIVDLPRALTGWTETVLSHSDLVYLVAQLNVPAVWQLRRLLAVIEKLGLDDLPVQLVLNRLQGSLRATRVRRRQAEKVLGRSFDYCIGDQSDVKFAKYRYSTIFWPPPNRPPPSFPVFLSSSMSVAQIIAPATFWTPNPTGITPP